VDCRNAVFIMTSNIGSRHLIEGITDGEIPESVRESVLSDLRAHFRPEFLNRIDDTVLFRPLGLEQIAQIVELLLTSLNKRLADRRIVITLDDKAREWVAERGYDPVYGARPLRRFLQKEIETPLAKALLRGEVRDGQFVTFTRAGDALKLVAPETAPTPSKAGKAKK
jgi:ATP-dependent Clp protease ATP-binding subunit ClpB